jgi:hypothetical protein
MWILGIGIESAWRNTEIMAFRTDNEAKPRVSGFQVGRKPDDLRYRQSDTTALRTSCSTMGNSVTDQSCL